MWSSGYDTTSTKAIAFEAVVVPGSNPGRPIKRGSMMEKGLKWFFLILFVVMIVFVLMILKPFIATLITSLILSYLFYPVYKKINQKLNKKSLSAFITILLVVMVIAVPIILATPTLIREVHANYVFIKQNTVLPEQCTDNSTVCFLSQRVADFLAQPQVKLYLESTTKSVSNYMANGLSQFLRSLPTLLVNLFVLFFVMFYFFRDAPNLFRRIEAVIPLPRSHYRMIVKRFDETIFSVLFGYILIGLLEGVLSTIIFVILGVKAPILLGLLVALFAILPVIGAPFIWIPLSAVFLIEGWSSGDSLPIIKAVVLIIFGICVLMPIDTILTPKIISNKSKVHPVLILLGLLGGIQLFGFIGILIGPVTLAVFMTFLDIFQKEKRYLLR